MAAATAGPNDAGAKAGRGVKSITSQYTFEEFTIPIPALSSMTAASYIAPLATSFYEAPPCHYNKRRTRNHGHQMCL